MRDRAGLFTSVAATLVSFVAHAADAAPITLRFSGQLEDVISANDPRFPPEETEWWTDLSGLAPEMPWQLTVTYDSDAAGGELEPDWKAWYYPGAVIGADLVIGPHAYTASGGDAFVNVGLPYGVGYDHAIAGPGQVQFQFVPGVWSSPAMAPPIWEGNMIVSYNDDGAVDGALPSFLDISDHQGLQSQLLWEQLPQGQGGAQFFSPNARIDVQQVTTVPEPATLLLLGAGMSALLVRHLRARR